MLIKQKNNDTWVMQIRNKEYEIKTHTPVNEDLIQNALHQTHLTGKHNLNKSDENKLIEFLETTYKFKVQTI